MMSSRAPVSGGAAGANGALRATTAGTGSLQQVHAGQHLVLRVLVVQGAREEAAARRRATPTVRTAVIVR